jgi:uncharacterized protein YjeT (DUF2065 family)
MLQELLRAVGLVLVIEGILPFLYPKRWRNLVAMLATVDDKSLRTMGLLSMVIGIGVLYLVWLL